MRKIEPVYEIKKTQSATNSIEYSNLAEFIQALEGHYFIVCWQHQGVYKGEIVDNTINWEMNKTKMEQPRLEDKHWQRARIFNELEEYYIHLRGDKVFGRHRVDNQGGDTKVIKSNARLRSIFISTDKQNGKIINGIEVNNYLKPDPIGKSRIEDMRFVKFISM